MNKLDTVFAKQTETLLSLYVTAGFPKKDSLPIILKATEEAGVDFVEVGMPFSDPLADGPIIQDSSLSALQNGMSLSMLFEQLAEIKTELPLVLMGYLNPVLKFGMINFLEKCKTVGVSGVILPDLPLDLYDKYEQEFIKNDIHNILLATPSTPPERIRFLAEKSKGFLYLVSSNSTTGTQSFANNKNEFLSRIAQMDLKIPTMVGFGIKTIDDLNRVGQYANGGIIGSEFIRQIGKEPESGGDELTHKVKTFVSALKNRD